VSARRAEVGWGLSKRGGASATPAGGNVGSGPRELAALVDRERALGAFAQARAGGVLTV
jgi:hypothetical protein